MIQFVLAALVSLFAASCAAHPHPSPPDPAPRITTVAVLEFQEHRVDSNEAARGVGRTSADRVTERLAGRPDLRLIDRESLQKVLKELAFSSSDLVRSDEQLRLGRLLGAHYLIAGGVTAAAGQLRIDGRIIEVEKGTADGTSVHGAVNQRKRLEETFSRQVADEIALKIGRPGAALETGDPFLKGLTFEMENRPKEALEMYQRALSLDPGDQEARERMERLLLKEIE